MPKLPPIPEELKKKPQTVVDERTARRKKISQKVQGLSFTENLSWKRMVRLAPLRKGFRPEERALLGYLVTFLILVGITAYLQRVAQRHMRRGRRPKRRR